MNMASARLRYQSKCPLWLSTFVALTAWIVTVIATGFIFVDTSHLAKNATEGAVIDDGILGLHLFQGFTLHGLFGIHAQSGLLIMLLFVVVVSVAVSILGTVLSLRQIPENIG